MKMGSALFFGFSLPEGQPSPAEAGMTMTFDDDTDNNQETRNKSSK